MNKAKILSYSKGHSREGLPTGRQAGIHNVIIVIIRQMDTRFRGYDNEIDIYHY